MNWDDTEPVLTGNPDLDQLTGGWQPRHLILVCSDNQDLLDEFFSKQIQGISQNTSTNIGIICKNMAKIDYSASCSCKERIIACGEELLKLNVVGFRNCEIYCLSKADIYLWSFHVLIKKMVQDFYIGIVFIEDINMITFPPEYKDTDSEAHQRLSIGSAKFVAAGRNIPIVVGLDNLSVVEKKDCKSGFCDCDVIGVLTNEYNTETAENSNVLELVEHRRGSVGIVNF